MAADELNVRCPNCGRPVTRSPRTPAPFFPFCSERCKLLDLGKWFRGEHRIEEPLRDTPAEGAPPGDEPD